MKALLLGFLPGLSLFGIAETVQATGIDIQNTRSFNGGPINTNTVSRLQLFNTYKTAPDSTDGQTPLASISSTPAVMGKYLYFNDQSGNITKLNRFTLGTDSKTWKKNYVSDISDFARGFGIVESRNTPYVTKGMRRDLVIVGSNFALLDPLCKPGQTPKMNVCHTGDGAVVVALDKVTGAVVWRAKADTHPSAKVTGSISGAYNVKIFDGTTRNVIFVGVSSWEEDWARDYPNIYQTDTAGNQIITKDTNPNSPTYGSLLYPKKTPSTGLDLSKYPCCTTRGALVAMDASTGKVLWKTRITPGSAFNQTNLEPTEKNPAVAANLLPLLAGSVNAPAGHIEPTTRLNPNPGGFFGASPYGHNATLDLSRGLVYIATAQNETAPVAAEDCEKARRAGQPDPAYLAAYGVTCANLNDKLRNYASSVLALNIKDGTVKWVFHSRLYDAWNHACGAPDFYGWGLVIPLVFPAPLVNAENCFADPVGPDLGFGHHPVLLKRAHNGRDLLVVGNKDGRVFGLDPSAQPDSNGAINALWTRTVDPGGIYGGMQFGRATDGKNIYFGTTNSQNVNRDPSQAPVGATEFLQKNGFQDMKDPHLNIRVGLFSQGDSDPQGFRDMPAPGAVQLPFPGPSAIYGASAGYDQNLPFGSAPNFFPVYPLTDPATYSPMLTGPSSGPVSKWYLTNPPADVSADGLTVFQDERGLYTYSGMVQSIDAYGKINWQRPAYDGIKCQTLPSVPCSVKGSSAFGTLTVGNGVVFIGYADGHGTMVALDANTGVKKFQFNSATQVFGQPVQGGNIESGPQVVGRRVYWGVGSETTAAFPDKNFQFKNGGNSLHMFILPPAADDVIDATDRDTNLND